MVIHGSMGSHEPQTGVLAAAMVVLLVAGCSKVVDGRAVIAMPRPGTPVHWAPCEPAASDGPHPAGRRMRNALGAGRLREARR